MLVGSAGAFGLDAGFVFVGAVFVVEGEFEGSGGLQVLQGIEGVFAVAFDAGAVAAKGVEGRQAFEGFFVLVHGGL